MDSIDPVSGISITLSFDDSPGLDDRTSKKRARMETLVGEYDRKYYPDMSPTDLARVSTSAHFRGKTYPNAILLVTSWDSVRRDAESSSIGTTMQYLAGSGLIDHQHPNVVVVVTKALTFWSDYDDFDEDQKGKQWQRDAHEKSTIINDLRSNTFSSSTTWPVIFVENGGGKKILRRHRTLPNGELSHQNLFEAIARIVTQAKDLVGIQALRFVTGADSVVSQLQPTPREVLCQCGDGGVPSGKERAVMVVSLIPTRASRIQWFKLFRHPNVQALQLPSTRLLTTLQLLRPILGLHIILSFDASVAHLSLHSGTPISESIDVRLTNGNSWFTRMMPINGIQTMPLSYVQNSQFDQ